jgi:oligopeptide transport system substrate-binding protein
MAFRWSQAALAASLLLATPAVAAPEQVLRVPLLAEPALDPHLIDGLTDFRICNDLFEPLVTLDAMGGIMPGAAASWAESPDRLAWTFTLRADERWSDGSPVTSADFLYSLRRIVDPKTAASYASALLPLKGADAIIAGKAPPDSLGVTAPDATHLVIALARPTPFLPNVLATQVGMPVPQKLVEAWGDRWTRPEHMLSNGPFKLDSWVPQGEISFVRSPSFHDAASVKLDRVRYLFADDRHATLKRYLNGEIDAVSLNGDDVPWAEQNRPKEILSIPLLATDYLIVNMGTGGPLALDARLRRALSLAIDRVVLTTKIDTRRERATTGLVPPGMPGYAPYEAESTALTQAQRIAEAKRLFAEALPAGQKLKLKLLGVHEQIYHRDATAFKAMWEAALPIEVELVEPESRVFDTVLHQGGFDVAQYTWYADYADPWTFLANFQSEGGPLNPGQYRNAAYDALLARSREAPDQAARNALYEAAERLVLADQAAIPWAHETTQYLLNPHVRGWSPSPLAVFPSRFISIVE